MHQTCGMPNTRDSAGPAHGYGKPSSSCEAERAAALGEFSGKSGIGKRLPGTSRTPNGGLKKRGYEPYIQKMGESIQNQGVLDVVFTWGILWGVYTFLDMV